jgi:hypothetical protein
MRPEFEKMRAQVNALRAQRAMAQPLHGKNAESRGGTNDAQEKNQRYVCNNQQTNTIAD